MSTSGLARHLVRGCRKKSLKRRGRAPPDAPVATLRHPTSNRSHTNEGVDMDDTTVTWIIVAVVVLALIVAAVLLFGRASEARRLESQRAKAHELRERAEADQVELQRREAEASRIDAEARLAQAEADARSADAARMQAEARERAQSLETSRAEVAKGLRKADEVDPDLPDRHSAAADPVDVYGDGHPDAVRDVRVDADGDGQAETADLDEPAPRPSARKSRGTRSS